MVVVIIPLVALMVDSVAKPRALSINCSLFGPENNPFDTFRSVLFVEVDYVENENFRNYIVTLHKQNLLSRMFFYEAHFVLTAGEYRPCMRAVNILGTIGVQKILTTATLPPPWENMLLARFGFPFATLRAQTTRSVAIFC